MARHDCMIDPINLGDHAYNPKFKTCTSLIECRVCGKQRRCEAFLCDGNGDAALCEHNRKVSRERLFGVRR